MEHPLYWGCFFYSFFYMLRASLTLYCAATAGMWHDAFYGLYPLALGRMSPDM